MVKITQLSDSGDTVLVEEEGDVLVAYKCPAGVWTISTGLTAASGVVKPQKGMTITRDESRRLRREALKRNYEPAVAAVINTERENVFDGALLFHWNTGAIRRASWVSLFLAGSFAKAKSSFFSWNKGGGKVLPGLVRRRDREWNIIENGRYGAVDGRSVPNSLTVFADHIHDFKALGYDVSKGAVTTITAFQRDHGLKLDGLIGPATRATLQRALAEKSAVSKAAAGGTAGGVGGAGADAVTAPSDAVVDPTMLLWVGIGALAVAGLVWGGLWLWRHRGPAFAWLPEPMKDWFEDRGIVLGRRVRT
ncbi:hypothetical protein [Devosia sp.]|uniref:glycoside hydrolase family protein n=1 Tax=Devosia sp. TaxID=1871048 RepID=UPI001AD1B690|nr:hypothetical protein [Devosia sp.]MBN9334698.1 hypothetical protein [Devosia sp.]